MTIEWQHYAASGSYYDELIACATGPRPAARALCEYLASLSDEELRERKTAAELAILVMGITFTVYTEGGSIDRAWPFDIVPSIQLLAVALLQSRETASGQVTQALQKGLAPPLARGAALRSNPASSCLATTTLRQSGSPASP